MRRPVLYCLLFLALVWAAVVLLINHRGEFPLIDDWAYARAVYDLYAHNTLKISDWVAMTQLTQLIAGWLWSLVFGFSLTSLRELTILIGFGGVALWVFQARAWYVFRTPFLGGLNDSDGRISDANTEAATHRASNGDSGPTGVADSASAPATERSSTPGSTTKTASAPPSGYTTFWLLLIPSLALLLHPLWSALSLNFMTDIPFVVLFMAGIALTLRWMRSGSRIDLLLAILSASALVLLRQTGIGLGASLFLWVLLMSPVRRSRFWSGALLLLVCQILVYQLYQFILEPMGALSERFHTTSSLFWVLDHPQSGLRALYYLLIQAHYVNLMLVPLLPLTALAAWRWRMEIGIGSSRPLWPWVLATLPVLAIASAVQSDILMQPPWYNLMKYDFVGHVVIIDLTYGTLAFPQNLLPVWWMVYGLSLLHLILIGRLTLRILYRTFTRADANVDLGQHTTANVTTPMRHGNADETDAQISSLAANAPPDPTSRVEPEPSATKIAIAIRSGDVLAKVRSQSQRIATELRDRPECWLMLIMAGYAVFIAVGQFVFDRYFLLHFPLALWLMVSLFQSAGLFADFPSASRSGIRLAVAASLFLLLATAIYTTAGLQTSFEWNRARFALIENLETAGVPSSHIDGGKEHAFWSGATPPTGARAPGEDEFRSWWIEPDGDRWAIALGEIPGYEKADSTTFYIWFGRQKGTLYTLRRNK